MLSLVSYDVILKIVFSILLKGHWVCFNMITPYIRLPYTSPGWDYFKQMPSYLGNTMHHIGATLKQKFQTNDS